MAPAGGATEYYHAWLQTHDFLLSWRLGSELGVGTNATKPDPATCKSLNWAFFFCCRSFSGRPRRAAQSLRLDFMYVETRSGTGHGTYC